MTGMNLPRKNWLVWMKLKAFQNKERPKQFDVRSLFPGESDEQVAEKLAEFFNRISSEFEPLEPVDIPRTHNRELPYLLPYQVAGRIRSFKKPKLMVRGDIFPDLMGRFAVLLAVPLTDIYNEISRTFCVAESLEAGICNDHSKMQDPGWPRGPEEHFLYNAALQNL